MAELTPYYGPTGPELSEGSYASSFIAPNIDEWGTMLSAPGIDERELARTKAQIAAETDAMRARGQHEFSQLINGGATPEEAYRRTAHLLNYNNPQALALGLSRVPGADTPFSPVMERVEGGRVLRTSPRGAEFIRDQVPSMPQHIRDQRRMLEGEIRAIESDDFGLKDKSRLPILKSQYMELGTNWMNQPVPGIAPVEDVKPLTPELARRFLREAGGDKEKARKLARDAGFSF